MTKDFIKMTLILVIVYNKNMQNLKEKPSGFIVTKRTNYLTDT